MKVEVQLLSTSQAIVHDNVINSYQKGDLFCVYESNKVYKYPIGNIFRIVEDYDTAPAPQERLIKG